MPRIRALVFDFDGLLVDTEGPYFAAWQDLYRAHGQELSTDVLGSWIGTSGGFDPVANLSELTGRDLDVRDTRREQMRRFDEKMDGVGVRPGIDDYLADARALGLGVAVASNSTTDWVERYLDRVGMRDTFDHVVCRDHVGTGKPAPDVYARALELLGVAASEAIAFEDSPNGIASAKGAGIFTVAVPNELTRDLYGLDGADLVLGSLTELNLRELIEQVQEASSAS